MAAAARSAEPVLPPRQIVHIVEDDEQLRLSLLDLFQSLDMPADAFESGADFFARAPQDLGGCILLDVRLPGANGIEFQSELEAKGYQVPIVFMTAHGDVATSVHAMKAGAIDFLQKPLRTEELLEAIQSAFAIDAGRQEARLKRQTVRDRASSLTPRETQVMGLVTSGLMNKQIAWEMGLTEATVKYHLTGIFRKLGVQTRQQLLTLARE